jgi:cytoskeletal protein RodZ
MLSKKLFLFVHKVALFAIIFATLAPSISHALTAQQGTNSFTQEVCSTNGEKITIQVVTTKGQQFSAELTTKNTGESSPKSINHHLEHCPFCANPSTDAGLEAPNATIIAILEAQAQHTAEVSQVVLTLFSVLPPPAQAPPAL